MVKISPLNFLQPLFHGRQSIPEMLLDGEEFEQHLTANILKHTEKYATERGTVIKNNI